MYQINGVTIQALQGDIAKQSDIDAVVNAANAQLLMGGGVAGAIHRAAGPGLEEECRPLAPISPGDAVITNAHNLPNQYVIHCLGPVYGKDEPSDSLLASCYRKAIQLGEEYRISSIAFPAISSGAFGYPLEQAANTAIGTTLEEIKNVASIGLLRFVLFGTSDQKVYARVLQEQAGSS